MLKIIILIFSEKIINKPVFSKSNQICNYYTFISKFYGSLGITYPQNMQFEIWKRTEIFENKTKMKYTVFFF